MKAGWQVKRLGEISNINYGYTESANFENVGPKFLRITDIQDDQVDWDIVPFCKIDIDDFPKYRLLNGDIVGATTGKSYLVSNVPDAVYASYLIRLQLTDNTLLKDFVYLFFQTKDYWKSIKEGSSGSAQGGFNATKLAELRISFPQIEQQQRIVVILDQAFEGIAKARANAEQNLQNARALFESHLQSVFTQRREGWQESKLGEVCNLITCGVAATPKYVDESVGVPFLSAQNVRNGEVVLDKYRYISKVFHQELTKKNKPTKGDVLYSRVGSKFGEAGVVEHDFEFSVYVSLTLIKPMPNKLDSYFLKYYLNSALVKSLALKSISSSGVPNLNVQNVREFPIKYPSISIQKEFVEEIYLLRKETLRLEALYQSKIALLDELKKSLLQQAFAGEL